MAKNIKVKEVLDNSVKVNIVHSPKMAEAVDKLVALSDKEFKKVVRSANGYRKANKLAMKLFGLEEIKVSFETTDLEIVNELISLEGDGFKKAIRCAKKYRRANKLMDLAKDNYKELEKADKAFLSQKAAFYA